MKKTAPTWGGWFQQPLRPIQLQQGCWVIYIIRSSMVQGMGEVERTLARKLYTMMISVRYYRQIHCVSFKLKNYTRPESSTRCFIRVRSSRHASLLFIQSVLSSTETNDWITWVATPRSPPSPDRGRGFYVLRTLHNFTRGGRVLRGATQRNTPW